MNGKGFTLIELLVVVLIIGILSAVALPQYQAAVDKSRLMKYVPLLYQIRNAQELYYLEHGTYTSNLEDLSIDVLAACQAVPTEPQTILCPPDFRLTFIKDSSASVLDFCRGDAAKGWSTCQHGSNHLLRIVLLGQQHATKPNQKQCEYGTSNASYNKKLCNSLGSDYTITRQYE